VYTAVFLFGVAVSDLNFVIFAGQSVGQESTIFAGQPAGNRRVTGRVGSWKSRPVPSSVRIVTIFTKWPLSWMFSLLVNLDPVWVMLEGQGHRSKFMVRGGNCCLDRWSLRPRATTFWFSRDSSTTTLSFYFKLLWSWDQDFEFREHSSPVYEVLGLGTRCQGLVLGLRTKILARSFKTKTNSCLSDQVMENIQYTRTYLLNYMPFINWPVFTQM